MPIGIPMICLPAENLSCKNVVYEKLKHLDDVIFRILAVPSQNMLLRDLIVDICICGYRF